MKIFTSLSRLALLPMVLLAGASALHGQSNYATPYAFSTLAGLASGPGSTDGTGSVARFNHPTNQAIDASGNLYVADTNNNTIRKIAPGGVVTTLAGLAGSAGSADGTGSAARFSAPTGVTVNAAGTVFVADTGNSTIRQITPAGVVTTVAGLAGNTGSTDGTGTAARFRSPFAVTADGSGNLYVADTSNHTIRKVTSGGVVTTLAGTANSSGSVDGSGSAARFNFPTGVAVNGSGNIIVADAFNQTIRSITPAGVVTTLAGSAGLTGSVDGTGSAARFNLPSSVSVDATGTVYVADTNNNTIRKVTAAGVVTTLAGSAGSAGSTDATGSAARFFAPSGLVVDGSGNVYVSDTNNDTIRKVTAAGVVTTYAGIAIYGSGDGIGTNAHFTFPAGTAVDSAGNIYVADSGNHTIRKITSTGTVTTLAGSTGNSGSADGTGTAARFNDPGAVAVDSAGNVYVADAGNATIRKVTAAGVVTTLAGSAGLVGSTDGTGAAARFNFPAGVAVDSAGNVYVADAGNAIIRKITAAGVVTTLAGSAGLVGSTDGTGSAARFNYPAGIAVDASGNVFVAEASNNTIRKITSAGVVTTLAGAAPSPGSTDGTGSAARFSGPSGLAVDAAGNLYVADSNNHLIRKVTSAGVVTTLGGLAGTSGAADGTGSVARFAYPRGVAVSAAGTLYIADTFNNTIRAGVLARATNDFNADGKPDVILENTATGTRGFWLMNDTAISSWVELAGVATEWRVAASADFNADGKVDLLWENTVTGDRAFWLMNGTAFASSVYLTNLSTDWRIAGAADFNGDGKPDIVLENTTNGTRGFWLMNGTTVNTWVLLGGVATQWRIAATADFDADGKTDLVWENTSTGDRVIWLLNGTAYGTSFYLASVPTTWRVAVASDFNGDGKPDLLWENSAGDRVFWMMNGTTLTGFIYLGNVATTWRIAP